MNPEFQRYLWLELTVHRMIAAPLVLAAVFSLVWLMAAGDSFWPLAITGYWLSAAMGVLWGTRNAAEAVISEVREGTWDQQRLSCLGAWAMTWGKLLGAPVFIWYACAPALVLIAIGASERSGFVDAVGHVVSLIAVLVYAHAVGLLVSLQLAARNTASAARSMLGLHLIALLAGLMLVGPAYTAFVSGWEDPVSWFHTQFPAQWFSYFTIGSLVLWSVVGCYRLMRAELQMRNAPWVWIVFVVFCMVYAAGFAGPGAEIRFGLGRFVQLSSIASAPLFAYLVAMALAGAMLFIERKDPVEFRRLLVNFRERRWREFVQAIPRWLCVLPIAAAVMLVLFVNGKAGAVFCASIMAFFARDAGIVMLLNLSPSRVRADAAALLYLLVLYGLLPAILNAASNAPLDGWLFPSSGNSLLAAIAPALVQAAVVWVLVASRWQRLWSAVERPASASRQDSQPVR